MHSSRLRAAIPGGSSDWTSASLLGLLEAGVAFLGDQPQRRFEIAGFLQLMDDRLGQPADRPADAVQLRQQMLGEASPAGFQPVEVERFVTAEPPPTSAKLSTSSAAAASPCRPAILGAQPFADQLVRPGRVGGLVAKFAILADNDVAGRAALARPALSSGFLASSSAITASISRLLRASSLIACCSCWVITSCCETRMSMRGPSPMDYSLALEGEAFAEVEPAHFIGDQRLRASLRTAPGRRR